ncbi:hypothetical protein TH53_07330 [Pedobacter lusitanus]|uniref:MepB protein n=1 Tax=Pedobacter lusitanus TaxID=1503925 RepID=A0A0D0F7W1_9SPHI|nr:MepB family protein [Pedobacter lusitanus]KIO77738.1 hypothetical protein TH53_07330 [Pedobacter lusitanus]
MLLSDTNIQGSSVVFPEELQELQLRLYKPGGFSYSKPVAEAESADYAAYSFELNCLSVRYRTAKITPTKTGQFVTLWKRIGNGPIQPFDSADDIDLFVISTRDGNRFGHFVFPKTLLVQKGIISTDLKEGKRAVRVYPPWDITTSKQAQKTQQWQIACFFELKKEETIDIAKIKSLYGFAEL